MLYPEDEFKIFWDIFIIFTIIFSCIIIPIRIAFGGINDSKEWKIVNYVMDFIFLIDIFVIFNSAFYDDNFKLIDDREIIKKTYLKSWFALDVISVIPFHEIYLF
jgi:hyperpolarization activated cyclic nucleotide-gated potassium channel 2